MEKPDKATVKAKIAGTVTTSCDKGTVPTDGSAAIVVKAADGMYVKTSISEMELSNIKVGGTIKCHCSLTEIDRKRLVFHIEVTDNKGRVGIGTHERFIVASEPFMEKAAKKLED